MDWEGFFICRTPDSFCDHGQVITWNFSLQVSCEDKSSFMPFRVVMWWVRVENCHECQWMGWISEKWDFGWFGPFNLITFISLFDSIISGDPLINRLIGNIIYSHFAFHFLGEIVALQYVYSEYTDSLKNCNLHNLLGVGIGKKDENPAKYFEVWINSGLIILQYFKYESDLNSIWKIAFISQNYKCTFTFQFFNTIKEFVYKFYIFLYI